MKNKRNTGLRAGVYQESSDQKSTLFDLLASILIFLAFAAIGYTISGFAARCFVRAEPAAERLRCGVEHAA